MMTKEEFLRVSAEVRHQAVLVGVMKQRWTAAVASRNFLMTRVHPDLDEARKKADLCYEKYKQAVDNANLVLFHMYKDLDIIQYDDTDFHQLDDEK